ncbi:hypothetical protein D3C73_1388260 [compost metagenome]
MGRAPNAPAKLMKLAQSETVGVLNHHNGRVRHVYTHFYDCRTYKDIKQPSTKLRHDRIFFIGFHFTVQ